MATTTPKKFRPEPLKLAATIIAHEDGDIAKARRAAGDAHEWLCTIDPDYRPEPATVQDGAVSEADAQARAKVAVENVTTAMGLTLDAERKERNKAEVERDALATKLRETRAKLADTEHESDEATTERNLARNSLAATKLELSDALKAIDRMALRFDWAVEALGGDVGEWQTRSDADLRQRAAVMHKTRIGAVSEAATELLTAPPMSPIPSPEEFAATVEVDTSKPEAIADALGAAQFAHLPPAMRSWAMRKAGLAV